MEGGLATSGVGELVDTSFHYFDKPFEGYNAKRHAKTGGLNDKYRKEYNREHGSHLKRPVTKKPSELKAGSKAANRRKSFCARMSGCKGPTSKDGKLTPKGAALKRWNCSALTPGMIEFGYKSGVFKTGRLEGVHYVIKNGEDLIGHARKELRSKAILTHPNGVEWNVSKTKKKGFAKSIGRVDYIKTPEPLRGEMEGRITHRKMAEGVLGNFHKNNQSVEYWPSATDVTGKGASQASLERRYPSIARRMGFRHQEADILNGKLDKLIPIKKPKPPGPFTLV